MSELEKSGLIAQLNFKGIDILNYHLDIPAIPNFKVLNFNFDIQLESKGDSKNKLYIVITSVQIKNEDKSILLGGLTAACIFYIDNFEEVVKTHEDGKVDVHPDIVKTLNLISLSTLRGIMYTTFKGTLLHQAILPILTPDQFQVQNTK